MFLPSGVCKGWFSAYCGVGVGLIGFCTCVTYCRVLTVRYLLPGTHSALPTAGYSQCVTYCRVLTVRYLLPGTHSALSTAAETKAQGGRSSHPVDAAAL